MFYYLYIGILFIGLFGLGFYAIHLDQTKPVNSQPRIVTVHKVKQYEILCTEYKDKQCIKFEVFKVTEE